jgi:putative ABC transport system permease protein
MITVALRGLLARKVRLLLTAVAIALGVSFVTGTWCWATR